MSASALKSAEPRRLSYVQRVSPKYHYFVYPGARRERLPGREGSPRRVSNTARWEVPVSGPQLLSCLRDVLRERLARRRTARGRRRASIAAGCRF